MTASITCAGCQHAYEADALFCPNCGRPKLRATAGDALIGKILGERFQILEPLGQGGSGTLYRAEHVTLRRKVCIKVLHDELSRDDLAVERFRREATTVGEIDNEHIVEIHDFGRTPDGRLYLAMELLEGETLDIVLAREKQLSIERTADILIQVGEALMEAHAIGYVHRDLRPRNVYLANRRGKANFVKLLDFGLAKLVETDASAASTSLGMTFGDPRYMSPEQARGDRIDRRADIYQLGCVAYEMLTGTPPFVGTRVFDILTKQVTEIPVPLPTRRPGVPLWVESAVAKMLAKSPDDRFATTTRMVEALRRGLETGEIMENEVARRRESVPPPSVSRVMAKMGITTPQDPPHPLADAIRNVKAGPSAADARPAAAPLPPYDPRATTRGLPPGPDVPKQDSVDLLRKRTGTPQLGLPSLPPAADLDQSQFPRTGTILPSPARETSRARSEPAAPRVAEARIKRPTAEPGISQVWYDDGDRASEEVESGRPERARKLISPSMADLDFDEPPSRGRRWGLIFGALATVLVIGGVAFALTRDDSPSATTTTPPPATSPDPLASSGLTIDAAPSTIISPETPDAAVAAVTPDPQPSTIVATAPRTPRDPAPVDRRQPTNSANPATFVPPGSEPMRRPPGGDITPPITQPPVIITTPVNPGTGSGSGGISGTPLDPYGGDPAQPPIENGGEDKKADFYSTLGSQQLGSGDTTSAASSFKKALELDANNAIATIGMGEIAMRQGLFGDAIAHLKKGARLTPRSSRVFTLLGEAFLSSGQSKEAASNFKKALQLDPDNTRARDGYNEASSRVPPPSDDP